MRLAPLALALALTGCAEAPVTPAPPPPPPPPPPRATPALLLTEQQAASLAADYARARGLQAPRITRAFLDARSRWHVDLVGPESHASVLIDAVSGRVLQGRFRLGPPPPPPAPPPPGAPAGPRPDEQRDQGREDNWDE
jgi:hypothetical protein